MYIKKIKKAKKNLYKLKSSLNYLPESRSLYNQQKLNGD